MKKLLENINIGFLILGILAIAAGINVFITGNIGRGGEVNDETLKQVYSALLIFFGIAILAFLTKKKINRNIKIYFYVNGVTRGEISLCDQKLTGAKGFIGVGAGL
ncbi:hypothetical protein LCGC14_0459480 [marine sediment metagenome]|uniref:Uncharacterized protein n=1 Tax=marine sediment metagenome TaxID=412755 RepID=A0A0F9VP81_9ZZZZ|nr:hypothetical protein [Halomonas sp.]HDZ49191.1 hypothetical protein [Halomonas sp.]HEB04240.1 hypothetical protein [Halomonas sp.]